MQGEESGAAAINRQSALQLVLETTTAALTRDVILQDFAQDTSIAGRAAVTAFIHTFFHRAFVEKRVTINTLLADQETAALSLLLAGRQSTPFWGLPNTGRYLKLPLVIICRFQADYIARIELYYDAGTLLRQLGLAL